MVSTETGQFVTSAEHTCRCRPPPPSHPKLCCYGNVKATCILCNKGQRKVFLPNKLMECLPRLSSLPNDRLRWNTNEEIASYLISFDRHDEWLSCSLKTRPKNGSIVLYNRKKVKYRKDGYCWKKRKDGKTTREDHMKLKVQGMENPDIVLVHYLNVPSLEDSGKCSPLLCAVSDRHDSVRWSQEDLLSQLRPMFHSIGCSVSSGDFSIEDLVQHILDLQRTKPQPRTHACLCDTAQGGEEAGLPLPRPGHLLLSPALPSPTASGPASPPPPPSLPPPPVQAPEVATLSLTLLPSPVVGGLLVTPLCSPPPSAASPPAKAPPPLCPSVVHPTFDPDSFLNSPKQGQTYGGPPPPASPNQSPVLCSSSPLSPPSVALSLSPTSTPPSSVQAEESGRDDDDDDEGIAPPTKLALLSAPGAVAMHTGHLTTPPVQVKKEGTRGYDPEDACMDTNVEEEAEPCERGGEELDISFDSQFPDLISDLITEVANPAAVHGAAQNSPVFLAGWSYPEGGVKVLITGPWMELLGRYSCLFDQSRVPAALIQPGVLRCYCPAHQAGLVVLQVLESGGSVSSSVLFEYRARNASSRPSSQLDWLSLDDNQFRMSILDRLEQMERRMAEMVSRDNNQQHHQHQHGSQLATAPPPPLPQDREQAGPRRYARIVGVCERMMRGGRWGGGGGERLHHSARHRGMTLLHLAAAQGYTHLIHTLMHWRSVNIDSLDLEQEVDPLNIDHFSCTPLMWACALGHQRAAELLYRWNSSALGLPDSLGRLPLAVARSRGHTHLATALEELHTHITPRDTHTPQPQPSPCPPSTSPDTGLSSSSSLPSPGDPSSPSPSSAYSSAPAPMDTSPSSPSSLSSSSLPVSPPSPSSPPLLPVSVWGEELSSSLDLLLLWLHPPQVDMATLAAQIIEATPERIKQEDFPGGAESPLKERRDNIPLQDTWLATYLDTVDAQTHSPPSALALHRLRPPSSAAWAEFLNASANGKIERDFSLLTLTDGEQRELYDAARIIQSAFRRYKGRRLKEQQDVAAAVIQRCYRKYKQLTWIALKYALYKKMTQAAILIQSKFRSYYEQKRFQQSRRAAVLIQQYYRSYKEYERLKGGPRGAAGHNPKIKGSFLTKKQDQAARKIMRFLRRCRHR
uniref:CG-1 domain-containing protein n=1 Tax=Gasterosteus aculeatus aculeatus TaxID=481459 RepID=A0AAQ4S614_GASAC